MSWPVTADFRAAVKRSHRTAAIAQVLVNGSTADVLTIDAGTVHVDAAQTSRRSGTIPLVTTDGTLIPGAPEDLLHVVGNELRLWRGINFGDGRAGIPDGIAPRGCELVPIITGPMYGNELEDQGNGIALSLEIYDRARLVADAGWDGHYKPTAGAAWSDAIIEGLRTRLPATLPIDYTKVADTTYTVPNGIAAGNGTDNGDPMATFVRWAAHIGFDLYFDPLGDPVLRDTPDPADDQPITTYSSSRHELWQVRKKLSRENTYSGVAVTGEAPGGGAPVRAIVWDDDPSSPTYYLGKFGPKLYSFQSSLVRSQSQANRAANRKLRKVRGLAESIEFDAGVDPSLEAWDVVGLEHPPLKITGAVALEAFDIPLAGDEHGLATTRRRRTA